MAENARAAVLLMVLFAPLSSMWHCAHMYWSLVVYVHNRCTKQTEETQDGGDKHTYTDLKASIFLA